MRHLRLPMVWFVGALLVIGTVLALAPTVAMAQGTPPARPPVERPAPNPPPPPPASSDSESKVPTPVPLGRITGTVIDLRTNAPMPGVNVAIGTNVVSSDANGNYDLWVQAGMHQVALRLAEGQGVPVAGAQDAMVWGNDVVTLHLFFISPTPVLPTSAPTPEPLPVEPPLALDPPADASAPVSLPQTAGEELTVSHLLLLGFALMLLGVLGVMVPRRMLVRAQAADRRLLRTLLTRDPSDQ